MNRRLAKLLTKQDWATYEEKVLLAVTAAVAKYAASPNEAVYQISIWTDPQALFTDVSFETKQHAEEEIKKLIDYFVQRNMLEADDPLRSAPYNTNPAGFKYSEYYTDTHDELETLCNEDYLSGDNADMIGSFFERALLSVRERVVSSGMLDSLPKEQVLWIGTSSPKDWYDHVMPVESTSE